MQSDQGYAPPTQIVNADTRHGLLQVMDPAPALEILRHEWAGEVYNEELSKWERDKNKAVIINEKGITEIFSIVGTALVNLNTALSNNDNVMIFRVLRLMGRLINKQTIVNRKEYGIDRSTRATIVMSLCTLIHNTFNRSLIVNPSRALSDKDIIKETMQQQQIITERPQQKKRFWGKQPQGERY